MRVLDPPHGGIYTQRSEVVRTCSRCEAEIQPGQEYGKSKGDWYLVLCENCLRPLYEDCQRYQARLRSSTTRVILGTDASPHGWAFIVIQDDGKGARREIHRAHGQNANDLPITPMEGMAVVQALRWFKAALSTEGMSHRPSWSRLPLDLDLPSVCDYDPYEGGDGAMLEVRVHRRLVVEHVFMLECQMRRGEL